MAAVSVSAGTVDSLRRPLPHLRRVPSAHGPRAYSGGLRVGRSCAHSHHCLRLHLARRGSVLAAQFRHAQGRSSGARTSSVVGPCALPVALSFLSLAAALTGGGPLFCWAQAWKELLAKRGSIAGHLHLECAAAGHIFAGLWPVLSL